MTVEALLKLMPDKAFEKIAMETKVDFQVKKLTGRSVFKLILFSMLQSDRLSLRVMESFLHSAQFISFSGEAGLEAKYNSIRDRICTINSDYFEKLFQAVFSTYNKELKEEKALQRADSTYITISSELIQLGMQSCDKTLGKKQIKYSINLKGSLPCNVKVFTEQSYVSEDLALTELINSTKHAEGSIVIFDRGLKSRHSFEKFSADGRLFVGRCHVNTKLKLIEERKVTKKPKTSSVTVLTDQIGYLHIKSKKTKRLFRVITAVIDATGEKIAFVTNILDKSPYWIADLYKQRWEIETFFKFIKQHLNVNHLVSRNLNGIKVMIYMTLILAILIMAYKKLNKIKGFKIAKLNFEIELENLIIKEIVILCGGNPEIAQHLFNSS